MSEEITTFRLTDPLPTPGWLLLEASAGTGKTYSLTALVARSIAERGLTPDQLLMVTFTRAAAAEMKHEVREQLVTVLDALSTTEVEGMEPWLASMRDCTDAELALRRERLRSAISTIDAATITTIHGFFQQALADLGIAAGDLGVAGSPVSDSEVVGRVVRDRLIALFAAQPDALGRGGKRTPSAIEGEIIGTLGALSRNAGSAIAPAGPVSSGAYAPDMAEMIAGLQRAVVDERAAHGVVDFDDIIRTVVELLGDPTLGTSIAASLRARYRLVLIDEFQDTDTEQWKVFSSVFDPTKVDAEFLGLIAVGDPKQAIYRFRGADIDAYLEASSDPSMRRMRLADNHRTDRPLVEALNAWLADVWFGSEAITYQKVGTPDRNADSRLTGGGAPLQFRHLREDPDANTAAIRRSIASDLVDHIEQLVGGATIRTGNGADATDRAVEYRDICVLVRGHNDSVPILTELRARGIPAVQSRIGSVLDSEAVGQLRVLLAAMAAPNDARRARALELTWFADRPAVDPSLSPADQDAARDRRTEELQNWARARADELVARGVVGWFQALRIHPEVVAGIATGPDALRRLTDLEHLVELVNSRLGGRHAPAGVVLRTLDELVRTANEDSDEQKRRIDTDHDVVQITTMHSAKGLEYPIVLMPYVKDLGGSSRSVYMDGDQRFVDCAPDDPWVIGELTQEVRKGRDRVEMIGDELRLLYVALTRAKHQLVLWWGCSASNQAKGLFNGSLPRVWFGDTHDLTTTNPRLSDDEVATRLATLAEELGESATYLPFVGRDGRRSAPSGVDLGSIEAAGAPDHPLERAHWYRWSYSTISKGVRDLNEGDARGGYDEAHGDAVASIEGPTFTGPLVGLPASNVFGSAVHELMERIDFAAADLEAEVARVVEASGMATRFEMEPERLTEGLVRGLVGVIDTPLDPLGVRLRDITRADRLSEMEFHFPLGPDDPVSTRMLFQLAASLGGPFSEYFTDLANEQREVSARGLLMGSIDAVLRVDTDSGPQFGVVDYKTNRLHPRNDGVDTAAVASYGRDSMHRAMEHGDYPLQVLVYNVALHRMLSNRLPDYDIDRHIAPTLYLFVRGMIGDGTPIDDDMRNGVFAWRPDSKLIIAASDLLGGRA